MKCYTVDGSGFEGLNLVDRPDPGKAGDDEVAVDIHAVSLNYRDLMVANAQYGGTSRDPLIACSDMAGVVTQVGRAVKEFKTGDRVINAPFRTWPSGPMQSQWARTFVGGAGVDGILSEKLVYPAASMAKLPAHLSFEEGSTLTIAGLTAWAAVVTHGYTKADQWVLVHGTGGVSIFAVQFAKMLGGRTILTTSNDVKAKFVKEKFGVDHTINYCHEDWPKQVRQITDGKGVDVAVETVGGSSLGKSVKACGYEGRVAVIGVLAGQKSEINVMDFIHHQVTVRGIFMESVEHLRTMAKSIEEKKLRPCVDRVFPFHEARQAYEYLQSQQHIGKVVIAVRS